MVVLNYFNHDYVLRRSDEISGKEHAHVSNRFMCEKSSLYVTKQHFFCFT